jgi:hypothetical protein
MARSRWKMALWTAFAGAGVAWGQQVNVPNPVAAPDSGRIITVQEFGGAQLKCRVLRTWIQPDGNAAYEVQILSTGEKMTIAEANDITAPPGTTQHGRMTRLFHWGHSNTAPKDAPVPPAMETTIMEGQSPCSPQSSITATTRITPTAMTPVTEQTTVIEQPEATPAPTGFGSHLHRLFHPHEDTTVMAETPMPAGTQVIETSEVPVSGSSHMLPNVSVTAASAAQVSDMRQSWGNTDRPDMPLAAQPALPHADTTKPDPLQNLGGYTALPTVNRFADHDDSKGLALKKDGPNPPVDTAALAGTPGMQSVLAAGKGPFGPLGYAPVPIMTPPPLNHPITPAAAQTQAPAGQASAAAAAHATFEPNAFTHWVKAPKDGAAQDAPGGNAFTRPTQLPAPTQQQPMQMPGPVSMMNAPGYNPMPSMPPQPVASVMYMSVPKGQTPASFASPEQMQTAMRNATVAGYTPQGPAPGIAVASAPPVEASAIHQASMIESQSGGNAQEDMFLAMLHDALYPSQRETAAEHLAASNLSDSHVLAALADRACNDEAISVRTCCIRCLVKMHAATPEVRATFRKLCSDPDPAVSQAAKDGLTSLNAY